jgi:hypothetical protein
MLMNLHKSVWTEALTMPDFKAEGDRTLEKLNKLVTLAEGYEKRVKEETELTKDQLRTRYVGKVDPKKRMSSHHQTQARRLTTSQTSRLSAKISSKTTSFQCRAR